MKKKGAVKKTREVTIRGKKFERAAFMPTKYPGVTCTESASHSADGEPVRTYYLQYRLGGKSIFEKAMVRETPGDDSRWIPARTVIEASGLRAAKIAGDELPNAVRREREAAAKEAEAGKWTFDRLWAAWLADPEQRHINKKGEVDLKQGKRGSLKADLRYKKHLSAAPEDVKKRLEDAPDAPPPLGNREPKDLTPDDIDRFRLYLAEHYSRETTKSIIGLVTRIARYGASKGVPGLSFPIILRGKQLGKEARKKRAPNAAEYAAYLATCDAWPDKQAGHFQKFIAYTGVRRGSARNLAWSDVDLVNKTALLRDSKTGDVKIALSNNAVALLREHRDLPRNLGNPYIFTGSDPSGKRSQKQIDTIPRKIATAAGLPKDLDPCHGFRRFLATRLKKYGTKVGMDAGGWRDPKMLLHYQSATADDVRDALNEEDARIGTNGTA